jgi:hypothetical protein
VSVAKPLLGDGEADLVRLATPPELSWSSPERHVSSPTEKSTPTSTEQMVEDWVPMLGRPDSPDNGTSHATGFQKGETVLANPTRNDREHSVSSAPLDWHKWFGSAAATAAPDIPSSPTAEQLQTNTTSCISATRKTFTTVPHPQTSGLSADDCIAACMLIWCIWAAGPENYDQFAKLTRTDLHWRIRFADLAKRYDYPIRGWIDLGINTSRNLNRMVMNFFEERQSQNTAMVPSYQLGSNLTSLTAFGVWYARGILGWETHVAYGFNLAILRVEGRYQEAYTLRKRLAQDMSKAPAGVAFLKGFEHILEECGAYLGSDATKLVYWSKEYLDVYFTDMSISPSLDATAIGLLSMICYWRWTKKQGSHQAEREAEILQITGFPIKVAFQWALRLLLYLSSDITKNSSYTTSLEPSRLCHQVIHGLQRLRQPTEFFPRYQSDRVEPQVSEEYVQGRWKLASLAHIWVKWLCEDKDWFLPNTEGFIQSPLSSNGPCIPGGTRAVDQEIQVASPCQPTPVRDDDPMLGHTEDHIIIDEGQLTSPEDGLFVMLRKDQTFLQRPTATNDAAGPHDRPSNVLPQVPTTDNLWTFDEHFSAFDVSWDPTIQQQQSSLEGWIGITPEQSALHERLGLAPAQNRH